MAAPGRYWHISARANRESIQARGLIPGFEPYTGQTWGRSLVWLWADEAACRANAGKSWGGSGGDNDVWAVTFDGAVQTDPDNYAAYQGVSVVAAEGIPPTCLALA